jgi:hypothetical protein
LCCFNNATHKGAQNRYNYVFSYFKSTVATKGNLYLLINDDVIALQSDTYCKLHFSDLQTELELKVLRHAVSENLTDDKALR